MLKIILLYFLSIIIVSIIIGEIQYRSEIKNKKINYKKSNNKIISKSEFEIMKKEEYRKFLR